MHRCLDCLDQSYMLIQTPIGYTAMHCMATWSASKSDVVVYYVYACPKYMLA